MIAFLFYSQDGRLQAGDQLVSVDGQSLIGLDQEKYVVSDILSEITKFFFGHFKNVLVYDRRKNSAQATNSRRLSTFPGQRL